MNDAFRQAQDMFSAFTVGKDAARIPENVQAFAEDSVAKARETYEKMSTASMDGAKAVEQVVLAAHAGAKSFGDKVVDNAVSNTEAVFDAAQAFARAKSLPELARLQAEFMQKQVAIASAQTKELFDLSSKIGKQTFETMNQASTNAFEQMKKAG